MPCGASAGTAVFFRQAENLSCTKSREAAETQKIRFRFRSETVSLRDSIV